MDHRMTVAGIGADEAQRQLADALPILIMISDAAGAVQYFNRRWYEMTGQPVGEVSDWRAFLHPDDGPGVEEAWYDAVARGDDVILMRYRLRDAAGDAYRWFAAQAVAVRDGDGAIAQWIGAAVDVDDEIAMRAGLERLLAAQTRVAERYQRAALPDRVPDIPGVRFDVQYRPSAEALLVGGDWYDVFALPNDRVAVTIGDVAGHGLGAAVVMNTVRQSARAVALWMARSGAPEPAAVLEAMEETIVTSGEGLLATAIFGVLDLRDRTFRYACAGHPPPLLRRHDGAVEEAPADGTPLGASFGLPRVAYAVGIDDASAIVLYTDGVIEGDRDAIAGVRRLIDAVGRVDVTTDDDAALRLLEAAMPTDRDDAAIVVVRPS